jgi:hypothetical protein
MILPASSIPLARQFNVSVDVRDEVTNSLDDYSSWPFVQIPQQISLAKFGRIQVSAPDDPIALFQQPWLQRKHSDEPGSPQSVQNYLLCPVQLAQQCQALMNCVSEVRPKYDIGTPFNAAWALPVDTEKKLLAEIQILRLNEIDERRGKFIGWKNMQDLCHSSY